MSTHRTWSEQVRHEDAVQASLRQQAAISARRRAAALAEGVAELGTDTAVAARLGVSKVAVGKALKKYADADDAPSTLSADGDALLELTLLIPDTLPGLREAMTEARDANAEQEARRAAAENASTDLAALARAFTELRDHCRQQAHERAAELGDDTEGEPSREDIIADTTWRTLESMSGDFDRLTTQLGDAAYRWSRFPDQIRGIDTDA